MLILYFGVITGLLLLFWDTLSHVLSLIGENWKEYLIWMYRKIREAFERRQSLKTKVEQLNNGKKNNFISQSYNTMSQILAATGEKAKEKQMRTVSMICATVGIFIAIYLKSYMLLPILTVGLGLIPMWLIKFKLFRYNVRMQNELSVVLSMVTNSFIRCENIIASVKENLCYMNEPLKSIFRSFVFASEGVSPDMVGNLRDLKKRINNAAFSLWCDTMISCQSDINSKANLNAVIEKFANDKEIFNLLSAEVSKPMQIYLAIAALSSTSFPLVRLAAMQFRMPDIADILFQTVTGQAIVAGYAVVILYGLNVAITLSTSLE